MFKTIVGFIASIGNEDGFLSIISVNKFNIVNIKITNNVNL